MLKLFTKGKVLYLPWPTSLWGRIFFLKSPSYNLPITKRDIHLPFRNFFFFTDQSSSLAFIYQSGTLFDPQKVHRATINLITSSHLLTLSLQNLRSYSFKYENTFQMYCHKNFILSLWVLILFHRKQHSYFSTINLHI